MAQRDIVQLGVGEEEKALVTEEPVGMASEIIHRRSSVVKNMVTIDHAKLTEELVKRHFPDEDDFSSQISKTFTQAMSIVIVVNCIVIGAECQWSEEAYPHLQQLYDAADWIFLTIYLLEVGIKIKALGPREYFLGRQSKWNNLDVGLTAFMLCHALNVVPSKFSTLASTLRTVRIVRILNVLRHVQMLSIVVGGMSSSLSTLCWIVALLLLLVYSFGIFFTVAFAATGDEEDEDMSDIASKFDSLLHSMVTLTDMVMGGTWGDIVTPVIATNPSLLPAFFIFVGLASLGLLNLIVGVICEAISESKTKIDWQAKREALQALSNMWLHQIREHHLGRNEIDHLEPGREREQKEQQRRAGIRDILKTIIDENIVEFPAGIDAGELYEMLDADGRGELTHDEFVIGVGRILLGNSFQLNCLQLLNQGLARRIARKNQSALDGINERLDKIDQKNDRIEQQNNRIEQTLAKLADK